MRIVPIRQIPRRAANATQAPADLFAPAQREAPHERDPEPAPNKPATSKTGQDSAKPPRVRPNGSLPVAIVAVLLAGSLGMVAIATMPERDRAATHPPPSAAAPDRQPDAGGTGRGGTGRVGIAVGTLEVGTSVSLPGPGSRDWVAPGARSDGALVRADLAEESIEFRAANTQPGLPGAFQLSWSNGRPQDVRGGATAMLGVRPGGWVMFVVRPLDSPADLVLHLSGNGVAVTVDTVDGSSRRVLSAPAAVVTVALPAGTAATVTVTPAGDQDIGVVTAELL